MEEIKILMTNLNLKRFIPKFTLNEVDGRTLQSVTSAAELSELGINVKVKARVFYDELSEFKLSGVPEYLILSSSVGTSGTNSWDNTAKSDLKFNNLNYSGKLILNYLVEH